MRTFTEQQLVVGGTVLPAAALRAAAVTADVVGGTAVRERIGAELLPTTPLRFQGTGAPFAGSSAWGPPD